MPASNASRIAVILYTVREYASAPAEAARTLRRIRKIGYENVQVSGGPFISIDPGTMRKMADDAGLGIVGAHVGLDDFRNNLNAVIDRLHTYGCRYAAIPSFSYGEGTLAKWKAFGKECDRIGKRLKRDGIKLQYHNHAFEFEKLGVRGGKGGRTRFDILMASSSRGALQCELDVGWVARGGYDPAAVLAGLKGRVDQVHAKDWGVVLHEPIWRAVGEGGLNWNAIVKAGKAAGVKMWIVEQDDCPVTHNPFKSIAISFDNLMAMPLGR
jgi:sugar phosphate isomerase/epimerase